MQFFILPFTENTFLLNALIGGGLFALAACWLGLFLCLKKLSLAGDAMSHALLPGVGFGFLIFGASTFSLFFGGLLAGAVVSLILTFPFDREDPGMDRKLSGILSFLTALGAILLASQQSATDIHQILFGSILSLGRNEMILLAVVALVSLLAFFLFQKQFFFEAVDPASFHRIHPYARFTRFGLFFLISMALSAGVCALGALLVVGLMIIPVVAAMELSLSWKKVLGLAIGFSIVSIYVGLLSSYHWDFPAGPAIVVAAGFLLFGVLFYRRLRRSQLGSIAGA